MSDHSSNATIEMGSERNFGVVFAAVFVIIGLWPLIGGNEVRIWALAIAAVFTAIAVLIPHVLYWPNRAWFKFGLLLGAIVAPIVMLLVYITTFVTIGGLLRLFGKDPLDREFEPDATSYWKERTTPPNSMKNQF